METGKTEFEIIIAQHLISPDPAYSVQSKDLYRELYVTLEEEFTKIKRESNADSVLFHSSLLRLWSLNRFYLTVSGAPTSVTHKCRTCRMWRTPSLPVYVTCYQNQIRGKYWSRHILLKDILSAENCGWRWDAASFGSVPQLARLNLQGILILKEFDSNKVWTILITLNILFTKWELHFRNSPLKFSIDASSKLCFSITFLHCSSVISVKDLLFRNHGFAFTIIFKLKKKK